MSEVKFNSLNGNYGIYQKNDEDAKKPAQDEKTPKEDVAPAGAKDIAPDKVLDALTFMGLQKFAQIKGNDGIEPEKYLSGDRISSIETMMTEQFEKGVEKYADAFRSEFPSLSEESVLALAANAFARAS